MTSASTAAQMRHAAAALLQLLDGEEYARAALSFADEQARRWIEYRPEPRPGASLALMPPAGRKAAHRLLATALSDRAFVQAMAITSLEEVLDRRENGQLARHSGGYYLSVFGDPAADDLWSWRFEGHHLSVTMTVHGEQVSPAPVFFGVNPARVSCGPYDVSRPLAPEEDLGRAVLESLGPGALAAAVVAAEAPLDIRTATRPRAGAELQPLGVAASRIGPMGRALLDALVAVYLDRLVPELAEREASRLAGHELHFAWEGPAGPGTRHYYRVQSDDLLIEYDVPDSNHAHTVLRRPRSDFGEDILAAHYTLAH
ncbi:MAG TPA: DUF3500 domain-containing protein [Streptosporangiaceae bacterium]|jgi:hypothetical protein